MPGFLSRFMSSARSKLSLEAPIVGDLNPTKAEERSAFHQAFGDRIPVKRFTPEAYKQIRDEYLPNIGLGKDVSFSSGAFDYYVDNRAADYQGIKEAKMPPPAADTTIIKKLIDAGSDEAKKEAATAVQTEINTALKTSDAFNTAQTDYAASIATFKSLVAQVPKKYRVEDLIGLMKETIDTGRSAIEKQQKDEIASLEAKFTNETFKNNLKTALNLTTDNQLDQVKKNMLDDLKTTHTKQMGEFDKSTQESLGKLHQAAAQQMREFLFLADLHKNDPKMRAMIERIAAENRAKEDANAPMTVTVAPSKMDVSSVSLSQMEFLQRLGGKKIEMKKDASGNITYSMEMGMRILNPRYYFNDHGSKDMLLMAQAVRASGASGIVMKLNFDNPKIAEQRAREAFEACVKAGFPPDKIKLNVNGKMMAFAKDEKNGYESIEKEIFSKKPGDYKRIIDSSEKIRKELDDLVKPKEPTKGEGLNNIKSEMARLKEEEKQKKLANQQQPDNQDPLNLSV